MATDETDGLSRDHGSAADITAYNPFMGNSLGVAGTPLVLSATPGDRRVEVEFDDGVTTPFHHQWLRHSCYCSECGNPSDGIRFSTVRSFDRDVAPTAVQVDDGRVLIVWTDGHRSEYASDWLFHHRYDDEARSRRQSWRPTLWRSELGERFPTVQWAEASGDGAGRLEMYRMLRDFGIVRVAGLGVEPEQTERLADLIGPIHETTVYGRIYDVRAEPVAKLGAKTGMEQAPHIDDAFYYSPPGIDVFHCLVNTEHGGMSTYVDGFAIADDIRRTEPRSYELLTTQPISHIRRHPGEIDIRHRGPLISLDEHARLRGIRFFDRALAPLDVEPELVDEFYDAIRAFEVRMVDPAFRAHVRVAPGDGVLIDNHRVMHGRTAFDPRHGRHIRLCHVPRDEFHGRLRELSRRLDPTEHDLHLPFGSAT